MPEQFTRSCLKHFTVMQCHSLWSHINNGFSLILKSNYTDFPPAYDPIKYHLIQSMSDNEKHFFNRSSSNLCIFMFLSTKTGITNFLHQTRKIMNITKFTILHCTITSAPKLGCSTP